MNPEMRSADENGLDNLLDELPPEQRRKLARTWELLEDARFDSPDVPTVDEAWADIRRRLRARPDRRPARRNLRLIRFAWTAGSLAAALLIVAFWWTRPVVVSTPAGAYATVHVPDGSTVQLNSGTRLEYRRNMGSIPLLASAERHVNLYGEAYFEVASGDRPFIVETADARVRVLGTQFNVRAWGSAVDEGTEIVLEEGRVSVSAKSGALDPVILSQPGHFAYIPHMAGRDTTISVDRADLDFVLAWRDRSFAAVDRPITSILRELERRYALRVDVQGDVPLERSMTVLYGPETAPSAILHDICLVQGCRFRATNDGFALFDGAP